MLLDYLFVFLLVFRFNDDFVVVLFIVLVIMTWLTDLVYSDPRPRLAFNSTSSIC